jgi:glyoxylase-like metal-dependent hydrolase (beta-lactamase superfamily II)
MKQIAPKLHTFTRLIVGRVYLIEDEDGLTIIDTGLSLAPKRIVKQLEKAGHKASDVKRILITHAHPDHVGGLPGLVEMTGAEVWASDIERPVIEGEMQIPRPDKSKLPRYLRFMSMPPVTLKPVRVGRLLRDGDLLGEVMGGLRVVLTPGHAPGHIAFWQPEQRVLFCGDVIFNILNRRTLPMRIATVDMDQNRRSVVRLAKLNPDIVCFGHGPPLTEDAARKIRRFARRVASS